MPEVCPVSPVSSPARTWDSGRCQWSSLMTAPQCSLSIGLVGYRPDGPACYPSRAALRAWSPPREPHYLPLDNSANIELVALSSHAAYARSAQYPANDDNR